MSVLINPYRSGAGGGASSYYQSLTHDHTKLGSSDLSNYPVLVSLTDAHLKSVANGGHVDNVGVNNIWFASTSNGTSADKIPFEIRKWDASTGQLIAWVKATSLSHTTNTLFGYLRYGDATQTSDLSNAAGVYDASFWHVIHAGKNGALDANDSTSNGFGSTTFGTPTATTGKIDTGVAFSGSGQQYRVFHIPTVTAYNVSVWWNATSNPGSGANKLVFQFADGSDAIGFVWSNPTAGFRHAAYHQDSGGSYKVIQTATSMVSGTWYLIHLEWDGSTFTCYINGAADGTPVAAGSIKALSTSSSYLRWGETEPGTEEEMRFSTATRGASWILADYNNQNSPSTFVTYGTETAI